eukprot:gb/GEZN01022721.1/.p1 GENE.gb/GEZN01022721.1/~~gb/GEZN01022721.1/.p1  ORF type:complete len:117 (-),score=9.78 gb/GEZN01022721.1/:28-378(-)
MSNNVTTCGHMVCVRQTKNFMRRHGRDSYHFTLTHENAKLNLIIHQLITSTFVNSFPKKSQWNGYYSSSLLMERHWAMPAASMTAAKAGLITGAAIKKAVSESGIFVRSSSMKKGT